MEDLKTAASGNDFAIDDVSFKAGTFSIFGKKAQEIEAPSSGLAALSLYLIPSAIN